MQFKLNVGLFAVAAACAGSVSAQDLVVRIGHVAPTSGGIAHLGKDNEMAARMAIDELNARGLSIGGKKARFELLAEDDAADPKQATAVAQKLVDSKVNGVVGHLNSGTTIPASKIYNDAGIPQISPSATNPKYTRQGYKTAFRVVADDVHLGGTLGKYGYWSIITSMPCARAESTIARVRTDCPHMARPIALWCVSTTGMRASRPIVIASPTPSKSPSPSSRRCDV